MQSKYTQIQEELKDKAFTATVKHIKKKREMKDER
jgi:hypothetical protein